MMDLSQVIEAFDPWAIPLLNPAMACRNCLISRERFTTTYIAISLPQRVHDQILWTAVLSHDITSFWRFLLHYGVSRDADPRYFSTSGLTVKSHPQPKNESYNEAGCQEIIQAMRIKRNI